MSEEFPGVIWITGFSGARKTTVARKVETALRADGLRTLALDGDDLRSFFAHRLGYERADRVDIPRVYFHLCSHIAAQGLTVRRFIVKEKIEARLRASGFAIDRAIEADGQAVYGDDNPVVLRVAAHIEPHAP